MQLGFASDSLSYDKHVKVADRRVRGAVHMLVCKPAEELSRVAICKNGPAGSFAGALLQAGFTKTLIL